jgi:hypothetical protein
MRETAMEADHESEDARREGAREWRGGGVAVAGWSEAMAALGRGEAAEREGFCRRPSYPEFRRTGALLGFDTFSSIREIAAAAEQLNISAATKTSNSIDFSTRN